MFKNNNVRIASGILLSIVLTVTLIIEFRVGFNMLEKKITADTDLYVDMSKQLGSARVSIDKITVYPEIDLGNEDGDVIQIKNSLLKVLINGQLTDSDKADYGRYDYSQLGTNYAKSFFVEDRSSNFETFKKAYDAYFNGDPGALFDAYGVAYQPENLTFYQQSYREYMIPFIHNEATHSYYAFLPEGDKFYVMSCEDVFNISTDKVSVHYGNAKLNPQLKHTYSDYEQLAAANTIAKLIQKKKEIESMESPYVSAGVTGTAETYTSSSDNNLRKQMVSYTNYDWAPDGTAEGTTLTIDTTSARAKASEWVLTATTYSYTNAGLQVLNLQGTKSSTKLEISGNILNTLETERPYVVVVKYVNEARELVGIEVIDNRTNALLGNSYHNFMSALYSKDADIESVVAVQFEVY